VQVRTSDEQVKMSGEEVRAGEEVKSVEKQARNK